MTWSRWNAGATLRSGRAEVAAAGLWRPVPAVPGPAVPDGWTSIPRRLARAHRAVPVGALAIGLSVLLWAAPALWGPASHPGIKLTVPPAATGPAPAFPGGPGPAAFARVSAAALRAALTAAEPPSGGPPPSWWSPALAAAAAATGVPVPLLGAVAQEESQGNPRAVSPAGALGLMQLMPATAAALGVRRVFDAGENALGGAEYLAQWLFAYSGRTEGCVTDPAACPGALRLALAAYNAGPSAVAHYRGVPPYPETQRYVTEVTALYLRYRSGN